MAQLRRLLFAAAQRLDDHLPADIQQQDERDPGRESFKGVKALGERADAQPPDEGHADLEQGKAARDPDAPGMAHAGVGKRVRHRDGKGVHREPHAEEYAV